MCSCLVCRNDLTQRCPKYCVANCAAAGAIVHESDAFDDQTVGVD